MAVGEIKKDIIIINIIKISQYITDLRTLNKNKVVSLLFFVYIKMQVLQKRLAFLTVMD